MNYDGGAIVHHQKNSETNKQIFLGRYEAAGMSFCCDIGSVARLSDSKIQKFVAQLLEGSGGMLPQENVEFYTR